MKLNLGNFPLKIPKYKVFCLNYEVLLVIEVETFLPLHQLRMVRSESVGLLFDIERSSLTLGHEYGSINLVLVMAKPSFLSIFSRARVHDLVSVHNESPSSWKETGITLNTRRLVIAYSVLRSSNLVVAGARF